MQSSFINITSFITGLFNSSSLFYDESCITKPCFFSSTVPGMEGGTLSDANLTNSYFSSSFIGVNGFGSPAESKYSIMQVPFMKLEKIQSCDLKIYICVPKSPFQYGYGRSCRLEVFQHLDILKSITCNI